MPFAGQTLPMAKAGARRGAGLDLADTGLPAPGSRPLGRASDL